MSQPAGQTPMNDDAIEAMAASWLVQRDEGFTPEQTAEFERWRRADPRHAAALADLEETSAILGRMPLLRADPVRARELEELKHPGGQPAKVIRFPVALKVALAAAACLALALGAWWLRPDRELFANAYATTAGGYLRVVLPDQSVLELNADTEAQVRYSGHDRRVTLARGEAHFTVAKNPARPFVVRASSIAVRALGTAFNVRLDPREVEVLVTEGRVQVSESRDAASTGNANAAAAAIVPVLAAGQRVVVVTDPAAARPLAIAAIDPTAMRAALAWQMPRLAFAETPLSQVVEQFNRQNRIQLEIGDAELGSRPLDGTFRADQVEAFARLLEKSGDFTIERPSPDRIVLRKPAK